MTLPVVAPEGTGTTILVAPQLVGVAAVPLKLTVLVPCVAPKFAPLIVTDVPTGPDVGERLVMLGLEGVTVKRSEEHTSELQSPCNLVCRLLLEKKKSNHHIEPVIQDPIILDIYLPRAALPP